MQHFLEISQLSRPTLESMIDRALSFKTVPVYPTYSAHTLALLFYENSTRTRVSFAMAAKRLSMNVMHLDLNKSSETKGEIIRDTIQTLAAMGINCFVIRHAEEGIQAALAQDLGSQVHLINAGDGAHAHPSQALLDMMTIIEQKSQIDRLKIAIIGDVKHSRVANSFQALCQILGVGELVFISPQNLQPQSLSFGTTTESLREGLADADVVMCLRVQRERLLQSESLDLDSYRQEFALTSKTLAWAAPNAMVLHPGPINRGLEIDSEVADGQQSYILQQVSNGVFARMAILDTLLTSAPSNLA